MPTQPAPVLVPPPVPSWRDSALPWIYVLFSDLLFPLIAVVILSLLLFFIPQAQEVLFGLIGARTHGPMQSRSASPLIAFLVSAIIFALTVWYASRLLATVGAQERMPDAFGKQPAKGIYAHAIRDAPRLLGAVALACLLGVFLYATIDGALPSVWAGLLSFVIVLAPLVVAYCFRMKGHTCPLRAGAVAASVCMLVFIGIVIATSNLPFLHVLSISLCTWLPFAFHEYTVWRRALLKRRPGGAPDASSPASLRDKLSPLISCFVICVLILAYLAFASTPCIRMIGSASVVLLFVSVWLGGACILLLNLRHFSRSVPGYLSFLITVFTISLPLASSWFSFNPFAEKYGQERLATDNSGGAVPASPTPLAPSTQRRDIIVNAHGGGLRATLFTAELLADLDDQSCGDFGNRILRMSGVSGGSIGIALYQSLRQDFLDAGGWSKCTAQKNQGRPLRNLESSVIAQDHLSTVLARMLTRDLVPGLTPQRGQALIESFQSSYEDALLAAKIKPVPQAGLAKPLNPGNPSAPALPEVFFNSTDATTGFRMWLSNRGQWQNTKSSASGTLPKDYQLAQAVLHSARFPLVSPAGILELDTQKHYFVDGGYADNSGISTLDDTTILKSEISHWLNIDGNPPKPVVERDPEEKDKIFPTAIGALLAVRASQAQISEKRMELKIGKKPTLASINIDAAFKDDVKRKDIAERFRRAPLGWYLTPTTVSDMNLSISHEAAKMCNSVENLCRQPG